MNRGFVSYQWCANAIHSGVRCRGICTLHSTLNEETPVPNQKVIPFHHIPGPKGLPIIGNLWRYMPFIGHYRVDQLDRTSKWHYDTYGSIVREHVVGDLNILHLFDPKDIESLFHQEGKYPERRSHRALGQYRKERPHTYSSGGIFCENGSEWYRLRKMSQVPLLNSKIVSSYLPHVQGVTNELINLIRRDRNSHMEMVDFQQDLYKWALENTCRVTMDTSIGCLDPELNTHSEGHQVILAAHEVMEGIHSTELSRVDLWRLFPTKFYRKLTSGQDMMAQVVTKYLKHKETELKTNDPSSSNELPLTHPDTNTSVVSYLIGNKTVNGASFGDILSIMLDLMLAGIDTTSFSSGFLLYYLAKNPDKQEILRNEVKKFFPKITSPITYEAMGQMEYLKSCVRESMRLTPVALGVGRVTSHSIIIRNYQIPTGTMVISHNQVASRSLDNFANPDSFIPERWMVHRDKRPNPFVSLPFGYGARSCPGKRISELNTFLLLIQVMRHFRVEYHYGDIGIVTRLINVPDKEMKFRFIDIDY